MLLSSPRDEINLLLRNQEWAHSMADISVFLFQSRGFFLDLIALRHRFF